MGTAAIQEASLIARRAAIRLELWWRASMLALRIAHDPSLSAMLELATPTTRRRYAGIPAAEIIRGVRRTLRHPLLMRKRRCLREGLLAYRFLVEAGYRPQLHFGVDPAVVTSPRAVAHCWVTLDGIIIIGETHSPFIEIFLYPEITVEDGPGNDNPMHV